MAIPISNVTRRVVYAASGTGPYNFTFEILAATDVAVYRDDTLLTLTTNYTVTINSNGTGYITLTAAPTGATQIAIVGNRTISRSSDFTTGGDFFANTLNDELDQQTIFNQQNAEGLDRALKAPQTDPTTIDMTLPRAADRANKTLAFDANGDPTLGISAADVANAVTYATNAANSATAAASSASSASSSASTASTAATNASTSATSAASSASSASSSASSASTSASNASTSATNAASSASSASTSASNASTSATNAASSATSASGSASTATTQATNAANSATAAATSASDAATSAAAAAAALDNFDDRYLGAKSSNPTVDNDGNALVTGALYYRTTTPVGMKVYDGSQWLEASAAQQSLLVTYEFVATSGQTTFSGADANGATLSYVANSISVLRNGVMLRPGDEYTATNGTSVVLTSAAAAGDEIMVIAYAVFNVANTYTQGQLDGFLSGKQAADAELTTLAGMSSSRATFLASSNQFGFINRILNGGMVIDQRNAGSSVTANDDTYAVDRFKTAASQSSKLTAQRNAGSVTPPAGFSNYLGYTSSSAYSVGSSDYFVCQHGIEGFNIADLAWGTASAQSITLSFWVRSSLTGTFGGSLRNASADRSYPFTYTISAANTWEQKTINIAGDTSGTWGTGNGIGISLGFGLGVGSTLSGTAGAWAGANYRGATGATSVVGTNGATWYVTGVQLEKGSAATPFDFRHYGQELALCQRYFEKSFAADVAPANGVYSMGYIGYVCFADQWVIAAPTILFKVNKRAVPTISFYGTSSNKWQINDNNNNWNDQGATGTNFQGAIGTFTTGFSAGVHNNGSSGYAIGTARMIRGDWTASSEL